MIIINSDDFAYSPATNKATVMALEQNLISSTTALMNFKEGLEDAVAYVGSGQVKAAQLGIHLNLTEGEPLSNRIKDNPKFCRNGILVTSRENAILKMDELDTLCVQEELNAQLTLFKERFGFSPSHIDSHHHIHTEWAIMKCVVGLAKKHQINAIRLSRNIGDIAGFKKKLYKGVFNKYLRYKGFKTVDFFGDITDINVSTIFSGKSYEIMVHALLAQDGDYIVDLDANNLKKKLGKMFKAETWELSTYSDIRK